MTKMYEVNICYSAYCTYEIAADSEEEAYELASELDIKEEDILATLEPWEEANEIVELYELTEEQEKELDQEQQRQLCKENTDYLPQLEETAPVQEEKRTKGRGR